MSEREPADAPKSAPSPDAAPASPPAQPTRVRLGRFRALPRLLASAPRWVLVVVGAVLVALGLVLTVRPLDALWALAVYAGASAVLSGVVELARPASGSPWWGRIAAAAWVLAGLVILVFVGVSVAVLPFVLAALLVVGGLGELPRLSSGRLSERVLAGAWALGQLAVGVLALVWPDLTLVAAALLFGVRGVVYGVALMWRGFAGPRQASGGAGSTGRQRRLGDVLRWTAAVLVLAVAGGGWWASLALRSGLPVVDAFYDAPAATPATPGVLLKAEDWPGVWPDGAHVTRILYTTTDQRGDAAIASGIVVIPDAMPDGPAQAIIWDHGTTGVARACAPSLMTDMFEIQGIPAVQDAIARGWVIVATDYTGQGAAGDFPYLLGEGEARSALDAMRAARGLDGLDLSHEAVVWGHSQGGHAALWTGAIAGDYAPELDILGVAAISPAADPKGIAELVTASSSPLTAVATAWVLIPYSQAYDDVDFAAHVAPAGRAAVRELSARCTSQPGLLVSVVSAMGLSAGGGLFLGDLTGGALGERLDENRTLGPWTMPVTIAWGGSDEVIAPELQARYVADLCEAGVDFTWREYPGYTHMGIVEAGSDFLAPLVTWTADRFAGVPAPAPSC